MSAPDIAGRATTTARRLGIAAAGAGTALAGATALELRRRRAEGDGESISTADLLRGAVARMTTPLLPDDYLNMVNPLWSKRELRGRVVEIRPETADAATLVIRPGWGWRRTYQPGQYVGIAVDVGGRWHWRSYSISSSPLDGPEIRRPDCITITVKAMPEGFLSEHLVRGLEPGTVVRLALPQGDFVLPDPPPPKVLFWTGGSGITPVMSMLRTLDRRGTMPDVIHVHSAPSRAEAIFRDERLALAAKHRSLHLVERFHDEHGSFDVARVGEVCPDWKDREAWVCGPESMLESAERHWKRAGHAGQLHLERFSVQLSDVAAGGCVVFSRSGKSSQVDGATTILEAGEAAGIQMPFGCRMGICHTCVLPLRKGTVKDLRNGAEYQATQNVQTCITAAAGDCELEI